MHHSTRPYTTTILTTHSYLLTGPELAAQVWVPAELGEGARPPTAAVADQGAPDGGGEAAGLRGGEGAAAGRPGRGGRRHGGQQGQEAPGEVSMVVVMGG